jgi:hypothetical protein
MAVEAAANRELNALMACAVSEGVRNARSTARLPLADKLYYRQAGQRLHDRCQWRAGEGMLAKPAPCGRDDTAR